jgi:hypothetical protein
MLGNVPRPVGLASLVQLVIGLPLCYALAKAYGIVGVVAGLAAGETLAFGFLFPILSHLYIDLAYIPYLLRCLTTFLLAALWSCAASWTLLAIVGADHFALFLVSVTLWGLFGLMPALILATPVRQRTRLFNVGLGWVRILQGRP